MQLMAQLEYRLDLTGIEMPLKADDQARTVISTQAEEVYHKQPNKASVYYTHNTLPVATGFASVGYNTLIPAVVPATIFFSDVRTAYSEDRTRVNLGWNTNGDVYMLAPDGVAWELVGSTPAVSAGFDVNDITIGTVNGISYICYKQSGVYTLNSSTPALTAVTLTGLVIGDILGLAASSGYLVAYSVDAYYWCSLIDPTDFTPSQTTGAGGGAVSDIRGDIVFATSHSKGVVLYAEGNAVMATYTGNKRYPFRLKELAGSKGGISIDLIAYEANSASQFVYTKAGMQLVSEASAEVILPEVTDFLASKEFEDFDETTFTFSTSTVTALKKKIKLIASRYLIISYGINEFTHALVYDLALKKLGKLKITHKDVFEYIGEQDEIAKESVCMLLDTGEVKYLSYEAGTGVLITGKNTLRRNRLATLLGVEVENCSSGTLYNLPALNGKVLGTPVEGYAKIDDQELKGWSFLSTAKAHSLCLIGTFKINTLLLTCIPNGKR